MKKENRNEDKLASMEWLSGVGVAVGGVYSRFMLFFMLFPYMHIYTRCLLMMIMLRGSERWGWLTITDSLLVVWLTGGSFSFIMMMMMMTAAVKGGIGEWINDDDKLYLRSLVELRMMGFSDGFHLKWILLNFPFTGYIQYVHTYIVQVHHTHIAIAVPPSWIWLKCKKETREPFSPALNGFSFSSFSFFLQIGWNSVGGRDCRHFVILVMATDSPSCVIFIHCRTTNDLIAMRQRQSSESVRNRNRNTMA